MNSDSSKALDEAIVDCINCLNQVFGDNALTTNVSLFYEKNKLEILQKLKSEIRQNNTFVKIINNSISILCNLAVTVFPELSKQDAAILPELISEFLNKPGFDSTIITHFFNVLEAIALIHVNKKNK